MLLKFNQYVMSTDDEGQQRLEEGYGKTSEERTEAQLLANSIVRSVNPDFTVVFNDKFISIAFNNRLNKTVVGKHRATLDLHKVEDTLEDLMAIEEMFYENDIVDKQVPEFSIDQLKVKLTFSI